MENQVFFGLGKKTLVGIFLSVEKNVGWRIPPAIPGNVRNARPKNGSGGKKPPRAYRGGGGVGKKKVRPFENLFLLVGETYCWLEKKNWLEIKMSVGEFLLPKTEMSGHSL